jgi:DNA-binding response OmpR family regulator
MSIMAIPRSSRAEDVAALPGAESTILVVEGHDDCASSLADLFEFCGYRVQVANSGREALRLTEPSPDIVITELLLPDIDGYELVHQLRARRGVKPQLVIAVTSRPREAHRDAAQGNGVDLYLSKPAEPRKLLAAVARFSRARNLIESRPETSGGSAAARSARLECHACGLMVTCSDADFLSFVQRGWPKCCGETMAFTAGEVTNPPLEQQLPHPGVSADPSS